MPLSEQPSSPDSPNPQPPSALTDIEQSLAEAESLLNELKQRYHQVQSAQQQHLELQEQLQQDPLPSEVNQLKQQLEMLEVDLESRLITWRDQRELFWQFLRFAGVGFVGALLLNWLIR